MRQSWTKSIWPQSVQNFAIKPWETFGKVSSNAREAPPPGRNFCDNFKSSNYESTIGLAGKMATTTTVTRGTSEAPQQAAFNFRCYVLCPSPLILNAVDGDPNQTKPNPTRLDSTTQRTDTLLHFCWLELMAFVGIVLTLEVRLRRCVQNLCSNLLQSLLDNSFLPVIFDQDQEGNERNFCEIYELHKWPKHKASTSSTNTSPSQTNAAYEQRANCLDFALP